MEAENGTFQPITVLRRGDGAASSIAHLKEHEKLYRRMCLFCPSDIGEPKWSLQKTAKIGVVAVEER